MTQVVGELAYITKVDTKEAITDIDKLEKSLSGLIDQFKNTESVSDFLSLSFRELGKDASKTGKELEGLENQSDGLANELDKTIREVDQLGNSLNQTDNDIEKLDSSMGQLDSETKQLEASLSKLDGELDQVSNGLKEADQETKQLDNGSKGLTGNISLLSSKFVGYTAAVAGAVVVMNEATSATLTNSMNQATLQSNLNLTDQEVKVLTKDLKEQGEIYGFTSDEMLRLAALNSQYVTDADQLATANTLVAQTATLYALKEGDVTQAADMAVTAQEGLRDVILTGSTTAFEDAGLSLDLYSEKLIEATGWTNKEVEAITAGTNGVFEYTEALSKAADPQDRFTALAEATNEQFTGMTEEMSLAGEASLAFQQTMTELKNVMIKVSELIAILVGGLVLLTEKTIGAFVETEAFAYIIQELSKYVSILIGFWKEMLAILIPIVVVYVELLIPILLNLIEILKILWEALLPIIQAFSDLVVVIATLVAPILEVILIILGTLINELLLRLIPIIESLANLISTVLSTALNLMASLLNAIVDVAQKVIDIIQGIIDVIQNLIDLIFGGLQDAFNAVTGWFGSIGSNIGFNFNANVVPSNPNIPGAEVSSNIINNSNKQNNVTNNFIVESGASFRNVQKGIERAMASNVDLGGGMI